MNQTKKSIWILEDDPGSCFVYQDILEAHYTITYFQTLETLKNNIFITPLDCELLIADLRLSDGNFLTFLKQCLILKQALPVNFVVVSSMDDLEVLRACYSCGASDFITKPFTRNELLIKIERILEMHRPNIKAFELNGSTGSLKIDTVHMRVTHTNGESIHFTAKELQIFLILIEARGLPVLRQHLQKKIWQNISVSRKSFDVHLFNLRKKIEPFGFKIHFQNRQGYRLSDHSTGSGNGMGHSINS